MRLSKNTVIALTDGETNAVSFSVKEASNLSEIALFMSDEINHGGLAQKCVIILHKKMKKKEDKID